jgi:hypothetical protein
VRAERREIISVESIPENSKEREAHDREKKKLEKDGENK